MLMQKIAHGKKEGKSLKRQTISFIVRDVKEFNKKNILFKSYLKVTPHVTARGKYLTRASYIIYLLFTAR